MTRNEETPLNTSADRPIITLDYDLYAHYLEDSDLSEAEKREFIETMWGFIVDLMSIGYEIHPVQQAQEACGKLSKSPVNPPHSRAEMVQSGGQFIETKFSNAANDRTPEAAGRIQNET